MKTACNLAGRWLMILSLCSLMGLHWGVLQTVAWGGMLIHYSHGESVGSAVEKTFDGQHPCPLCKAIAKSQQSSGKTPEFQPAQKIDMDFPGAVVIPAPAANDFSWPLLVSGSVARGSEPIVPPPRVA